MNMPRKELIEKIKMFENKNILVKIINPINIKFEMYSINILNINDEYLYIKDYETDNILNIQIKHISSLKIADNNISIILKNKFKIDIVEIEESYHMFSKRIAFENLDTTIFELKEIYDLLENAIQKGQINSSSDYILSRLDELISRNIEYIEIVNLEKHKKLKL